MALRSQIRVAVTFLVLLALFNGVYQLEKRVSGHFIDLPFTRLVTAGAACVGAWVLPFPVERRGDITLSSSHTAVVVRGGCNGLEALFLMAAGILAFPCPWRRRGRAMLGYLPALYALNLLRILMLLFVMTVYPSCIDMFHDQIGQGILVCFVFAFWIHYVHYARR